MSASKKRHIEQVESNSSQSSSDDESDEGSFVGNEIQVDLEGRSPTDSDCQGLTQLLNSLFLTSSVTVKNVAELVIEQNYVGSVIYQSEDEEDDDDDEFDNEGNIFGVTTVINLTKKKDLECVQQIREHLLEKAKEQKEGDIKTKIQDILNDDTKSVGLLINERFVNIPAQISMPLLESLQKEMKDAAGKGMPFDFEYIVMMIKFFRNDASESEPSKNLYTNEEEEIFQKHALHQFDYLVSNEVVAGVEDCQETDDETMKQYRKVILFDGKKLEAIINEIGDFINKK